MLSLIALLVILATWISCENQAEKSRRNIDEMRKQRELRETQVPFWEQVSRVRRK